MLTGTFKNMFASFLGSSSHLWEIFRIKYIRCAFRTLTNVYAGGFCKKFKLF